MKPILNLESRSLVNGLGYEIHHFWFTFKRGGKLHKVSVFKEQLEGETPFYNLAIFLDKTKSIIGQLILCEEQLSEKTLTAIVEEQTQVKLEL